MRLPVALTMGDPAGVGGEIACGAWRALREETPFYIIADPDWLKLQGSGADVPIAEIARPQDASRVMPNALPVLPLLLSAPGRPGSPVPQNANAIVRSIELAVRDVQAGRASALCTNPINKKVLKDAVHFNYPGHTEFLAVLGGIARPVMMIAGPLLKVVPVTIHIGIDAVPKALNAGLLRETIEVTHTALVQDFGIATPRIAVAGLNPHAGEGGQMGKQEMTIIAPVLDALRAKGMTIAGPLSADTMFHPAARERYDVAVCMYHDQALIPAKTLSFDEGVNVTLGLPFVRTSPDHGTAYDIAGKGIAKPDSLIAAIRLAAEIAGNRIDHAGR